MPIPDPTLVWIEGTAGVAVAQERHRSARAPATLAAIDSAQAANGALPGATRETAAAGITTAPALAATAWFLLAHQSAVGQPSIWIP